MFLCFIIVQNLILTEIFFILTLTDCLIDSSVNCKTVISVSKPFIDKVDLDDSKIDSKTRDNNLSRTVTAILFTLLWYFSTPATDRNKC